MTGGWETKKKRVIIKPTSKAKRRRKKERKQKKKWLTSHRVDTYKTSQANQVTRGFTRVSTDRQPRYYESSN